MFFPDDEPESKKEIAEKSVNYDPNLDNYL